jgi:hypothetical protein
MQYAYQYACPRVPDLPLGAKYLDACHNSQCVLANIPQLIKLRYKYFYEVPTAACSSLQM